MLARSEVMCSMPPSAAWKAKLFCVSWLPTLPSVFTIMSRPMATPDMINIKSRVAIRVNPRESSFVLCIVSLLIAILRLFVSVPNSLLPPRLNSRAEEITILVTQVSRTDGSLRVESLVAIGRHETAPGTRDLGASGQVNQIDLANQIEGCAGRVSSIARRVEQVATGVVGVISELQVGDALLHRCRRLPVHLAH